MKTIYWNYLSLLFVSLSLITLLGVVIFNASKEYSFLVSSFVILYLITNNVYYKKLTKEKNKEIFDLKLKLNKFLN